MRVYYICILIGDVMRVLHMYTCVLHMYTYIHVYYKYTYVIHSDKYTYGCGDVMRRLSIHSISVCDSNVHSYGVATISKLLKS